MSGIEHYSNKSVQVIDGVRFTAGRDKYGRSCYQVTTDDNLMALGMIVRLPKQVVAQNPDRTYLTNDWTLGYESRHVATQEHRKLDDARQRFIELAKSERVQALHTEKQVKAAQFRAAYQAALAAITE
jgi:hypothetical protein